MGAMASNANPDLMPEKGSGRLGIFNLKSYGAVKTPAAVAMTAVSAAPMVAAVAVKAAVAAAATDFCTCAGPDGPALEC